MWPQTASNLQSYGIYLAEISIKFSTLSGDSEAFKLNCCVFFSKVGFEEVSCS